MIEHIVLFRLNDGVTNADVDAFITSLHAVASDADGVVSFRLERDAGLRGSVNENLALIARFRDEAAFDGYLTHPAHLAVLADLAPRLIAAKHGIQLHV